MDFKAANEAIQNLFKACEIDYNENTEAQFVVLMSAMKLFNDRNKVYGDTWKQYGALNNLLRAATKVDRTMAIWWHEIDQFYEDPIGHKDSLDDAIDAVNYIVFFIRGVRDGDLTGSAPVRPQAQTIDTES